MVVSTALGFSGNDGLARVANGVLLLGVLLAVVLLVSVGAVVVSTVLGCSGSDGLARVANGVLLLGVPSPSSCWSPASR